jgi:hypothetical protein
MGQIIFATKSYKKLAPFWHQRKITEFFFIPLLTYFKKKNVLTLFSEFFYFLGPNNLFPGRNLLDIENPKIDSS